MQLTTKTKRLISNSDDCMNATVYLFGEFNSGYSQYPDDYTSKIFRKFHENAKSMTQIIIHRDGNLMYYGYIRKLEQERYIGLCVVLNGLLLTRIDELFSLFENIISGLVTMGQLIHFNEQGDIITKVEKLYMNKEEIDLLNESLRAGFNRFKNYITTLPAVSFGTPKDSVKDFIFDDNLGDIIKSSYTSGYTFVYKSKNFNTAQMNSYKGVLNRVNNEKKELQDKLEKLHVEHVKTLRQKKQFKFVIVLFIVLLGCTIALFSLNDNLNITRDALSYANDTINMQNDSLSNQSFRIANLNSENRNLEQCRQAEETRRIEAENNLENLKRKISERQPFIVKRTSFDFRTGYLNLDYYGMTNETVTVDVRTYNDYGAAFSTSSNIYIESGDNSVSIYVNRSLDSNKWYSFEILKGNIILGGDRH